MSVYAWRDPEKDLFNVTFIYTDESFPTTALVYHMCQEAIQQNISRVASKSIILIRFNRLVSPPKN